MLNPHTFSGEPNFVHRIYFVLCFIIKYNTKGLKVKANIKKHFVCGGVILLCYVYLLTHEISDAEVYGFWAGLWQGGIFLPKFIISLFLDNVKFIAKIEL